MWSGEDSLSPSKKQAKLDKENSWLANEMLKMKYKMAEEAKTVKDDDNLFIEESSDDNEYVYNSTPGGNGNNNKKESVMENESIKSSPKKVKSDAASESISLVCAFCRKNPCEWTEYEQAVFQNAVAWESQFPNNAAGILISTPDLKRIQKGHRFDSYKVCDRIGGAGVPCGKSNRFPFPSCVVCQICSMFPDPEREYTGFRA